LLELFATNEYVPDLIKTLDDEALARHMSGFKPPSPDYILCQQEFARRLHQANQVPVAPRASPRMKVFVSHSSKDGLLAEAVVTLLRAALGLPPHEIRCTSVDGYRLKAGAKTDPTLREEVCAAATFVGLITASSIESAYVLFELGARWGADKHLAPLLAGSADSSYLRGPLGGYNALRCDNVAQLHQLVDDLAAELGLQPFKPATYERELQQVVTASRQQAATPARVTNAPPSNLATNYSKRFPNALIGDEVPPTDEACDILRRLALDDGDFFDAKTLARETTLTLTACKHFLNQLRTAGYITIQRDGDESEYAIDDKGREFVVENHLLG
jgi:hypothetical protein